MFHENLGLEISLCFLSHFAWLQTRMFLVGGRWEETEHVSILSGKDQHHCLSAQAWATWHQPVCLISVIRKLTFSEFSCGLGHYCGVSSVPGQGTSTCRGHGQKKKDRERERRKLTLPPTGSDLSCSFLGTSCPYLSTHSLLKWALSIFA